MAVMVPAWPDSTLRDETYVVADESHVVGDEQGGGELFIDLLFGTQHIEVPNELPIAAPIYPEGEIDERRPTFSWLYSDPDGALQHGFQVRIYSDSGFGFPAHVVQDSGEAFTSTRRWTPDADLGIGHYKWSVRAFDGFEWGEWSEFFSFATTKDAPVIPSVRYRPRVRVKRANQWTDITDRVAEGTIVRSNDRPVATLDLRLLNGTGLPNLSPRDRTSSLNRVGDEFAPLLDHYNEILVEAAASFDGSEPSLFVPMFGGYLGDDTKASSTNRGTTFPLKVRDYAKQLMDDYIIEPIEFEGNDWASNIIQALLYKRYEEGHLPKLIHLHVIGDDDFWINKPWQTSSTGESTWDAIQKFAQQSNKDIRFMLHEPSGEIRLTYWTPSTAMVPGWNIFGEDIIQEDLETSDASNRYRVTVHWRDGNGSLQSTTREDLSFKRPNEPIREMSIGEEHTELVETESQAITLADAVLEGLKAAPAATRITAPFNPHMQIHDVMRIENPDIRSESEVYAVEELRFNFNQERWNMEVTGRETVALRPTYWLSIENRPGLRGETLPPEKIGGGTVVMPKPENVVVSPMELGLSVHVPVPPVHASRWSITEVHVSTQQGFTPSPATRMAANRSTYIPVTGLQPGTPYYVRAVYVDIAGKRSAPSDEHEATPTRISGDMLDGDLFAIEPSSTPVPSSGTLESLWDMDVNTGVEFDSAPTITFTYPVYQGSDVVEMHLGGNATGYVQMRQRDTGNWINVLGSPSSPVSFVQGWNYHRFTGNKLYFGREYRLVLLQNVRVNELRFERVTVADLIRAGKLRLTGDMEILNEDGSVKLDTLGLKVDMIDGHKIGLGKDGLAMTPQGFQQPGMKLTGYMQGFWDKNNVPSIGLGDVREMASQLGSDMEYGIFIAQGEIRASQSVLEASLTDFGVTRDKLGPGSVDRGKLSPGAVGEEQIQERGIGITRLGEQIQVPDTQNITLLRYESLSPVFTNQFTQWVTLKSWTVNRRDNNQGLLAEVFRLTFDGRYSGFGDPPGEPELRVRIDGNTIGTVVTSRDYELFTFVVDARGLGQSVSFSIDGRTTNSQFPVYAANVRLYQNEQLPLRWGVPIYTINEVSGGCYSSCQVMCENVCESSCQTSSQHSCGANCEVTCQSDCETSCESTCETTSQGGGGCLREGTPVTIWDEDEQVYREIPVEDLKPGMILPGYNPETDTLEHGELLRLVDAKFSNRFLRIHTDVGPSVDVTYSQPFDVLADMGDGWKWYAIQSKFLQPGMKMVRPFDAQERRMATVTQVEHVKEHMVQFWDPKTTSGRYVAAGYADWIVK